MRLKRVPILLVIAVGVAHGVRILALYERPRLCFLICPCLDLHDIISLLDTSLVSQELDNGSGTQVIGGRGWHLVDASVHGAQNVCSCSARSASLIVHRP